MLADSSHKYIQRITCCTTETWKNTESWILCSRQLSTITVRINSCHSQRPLSTVRESFHLPNFHSAPTPVSPSHRYHISPPHPPWKPPSGPTRQPLQAASRNCPSRYSAKSPAISPSSTRKPYKSPPNNATFSQVRSPVRILYSGNSIAAAPGYPAIQVATSSPTLWNSRHGH